MGVRVGRRRRLLPRHRSVCQRQSEASVSVPRRSGDDEILGRRRSANRPPSVSEGGRNPPSLRRRVESRNDATSSPTSDERCHRSVRNLPTIERDRGMDWFRPTMFGGKNDFADVQCCCCRFRNDGSSLLSYPSRTSTIGKIGLKNQKLEVLSL